jgi:hypothetical protein
VVIACTFYQRTAVAKPSSVGLRSDFERSPIGNTRGKKVRLSDAHSEVTMDLRSS